MLASNVIPSTVLEVQFWYRQTDQCSALIPVIDGHFEKLELLLFTSNEDAVRFRISKIASEQVKAKGRLAPSIAEAIRSRSCVYRFLDRPRIYLRPGGSWAILDTSGDHGILASIRSRITSSGVRKTEASSGMKPRISTSQGTVCLSCEKKIRDLGHCLPDGSGNAGRRRL